MLVSSHINFCRFLTSRLEESSFLPEIFYSPFRFPSLLKKIPPLSDESDRIKLAFSAPIFCRARCNFCFFSTSSPNLKINDAYQRSLLLIDRYSTLFNNRIFHGFSLHNGRYLIFSPKDLKEILARIFGKFHFRNPFLSCEVVPFYTTKEKIGILREFFFNFFSLGIQSLNRATLLEIRRPQNEAMVLNTIDLIHRANEAYLNVDLIAGLPKENVKIFKTNLKKIITKKPAMVTIFPLVLKRDMLKRSFDVSSFVKVRLEIFTEANHLLSRLGYNKISPMRYIRKDISESWRADGLTFSPFSNYPSREESIITIGGQSCFNKNCLLNPAKTGDSERLVWNNFNAQEEIYIYLKNNFLNGVSKQAFQERFDVDFDQIFYPEIQFLRKNGYIVKKNNTYYYKPIFSENDVFEFFAHMKLFLPKRTLNNFKNSFKHLFNADFNYTYSNAGFWKNLSDKIFIKTTFSFLLNPR